MWFIWSYTGSLDLPALYRKSKMCCLKSFTQTGCLFWVSAEESLLWSWGITKSLGDTCFRIMGDFSFSFGSKTYKQTWLSGTKGDRKGRQRSIPRTVASDERIALNVWMYATCHFQVYCDVLACSHQVFFSDALNFPWLTPRGNLQVGLMWKIKTALRLSLKCSATN